MELIPSYNEVLHRFLVDKSYSAGYKGYGDGYAVSYYEHLIFKSTSKVKTFLGIKYNAVDTEIVGKIISEPYASELKEYRGIETNFDNKLVIELPITEHKQDLINILKEFETISKIKITAYERSSL